MSKKCLARTVIEGGRTGVYKEVIRQQKKTERSRFRTYCRNAVVDPDSADDDRIPIVEPPDNYQFDNKFKDKLSPMYGWLFAQVGKPWAEVYSLIRSKFDARTTAGRHIVFDHLLSQININNDVYRYGNTPTEFDFDIDEAGTFILTEAGRKSFFHSQYGRYNYKAENARKAKFQKLADSRYVIDYGAVQFWLDGATRQQLNRLTAEEAAAWKILHEGARKTFIYVPAPKSSVAFSAWLASRVKRTGRVL